MRSRFVCFFLFSFLTCASRAKVITAHGPRKPQRLSTSSANLSIDLPLEELSASAYQLNNVPTPTNSQKLCLETSFTSLQSPNEPIPLICCSSKTSSTAGSLLSRSRLNSVLHTDGGSFHDENLTARSTSAGTSEATTILMADSNGIVQFNYPRGKSVVFDVNSRPSSSYPLTSTPSPNILPKSILHRQGVGSAINKKPNTLSFADQNTNGPSTSRKIDYQHDDWFGMAPLASPETLSEISSISSRASLTLNLASSIEKYLNRVDANANSTDVDDTTDSQMLTPKVIRRTPKFNTNLSSCADDWRSVDKYKRMGKIFVTSPIMFHSNSDSSGPSVDSMSPSKYCTASSCDSRTTTIDTASCQSSCPRCPCRLMARDECCRLSDHSACIQNSISSVSDTYYSALSSLTATDSTSPRQSQRGPLLESHFPVYSDNETATFLAQRTNVSKMITTNSVTSSNGNACAGEMAFRRVINDDARNEALPLLANLNERNSPGKFNRRKNYVYPVTTSPRPSPSKRSESSV